MDGTGSGSCPMAIFGTSDVKESVSIIIVQISLVKCKGFNTEVIMRNNN